MATVDGELDTWLRGMLIGDNPKDKLRALKVVGAVLSAGSADPISTIYKSQRDGTFTEGVAPYAKEVLRNAGYLSLVEGLQEAPDRDVQAEAIKILMELTLVDEKEELFTALKRQIEDVHEKPAMASAKRRHVVDACTSKNVTVNLTAISGNKLADLVVEPGFTAAVVALKAREFLKPGCFIESLVLPSGVLFERQQSVAQVGLSEGDILVASIFSVPSVSDLYCESDAAEVAAQQLVGALDSSACVRFCIAKLMDLLDDDATEEEDKVILHLRAFEVILQAGQKQADSKKHLQVDGSSVHDDSGKSKKKQSKETSENWGEHLIRLVDGFDRLEDLRLHESDKVCEYAEKIIKAFDTSTS